MAKDAEALMAQVKRQYPAMAEAMPEVVEHFRGMMRAAEKDGALSHKVKELVTLGVSIAIWCDTCIAFHLANALKAGATREEIVEVCGVAIGMGGGPVVHVCGPGAGRGGGTRESKRRMMNKER